MCKITLEDMKKGILEELALEEMTIQNFSTKEELKEYLTLMTLSERWDATPEELELEDTAINELWNSK